MSYRLYFRRFSLLNGSASYRKEERAELHVISEAGQTSAEVDMWTALFASCSRLFDALNWIAFKNCKVKGRTETHCPATIIVNFNKIAAAFRNLPTCSSEKNTKVGERNEIS